MSTTPTRRPKRRFLSGRFETITSNFGTNVRRAMFNGREHYVVPVSMIVPGVLNGSKGPLYYPSDEIARDPGSWNGMPLVIYHPKDHTGTPISARSPGVLEKSGVGSVFNSKTGTTGKLRAEAWFDIERTRMVDNRVIDMIESGKLIEVSTGLFTDNEPANGVFNGKAYKYIARNYRPDHLAILPDEVGACSVKDGCGVNVNSKKRPKINEYDPTNRVAKSRKPDSLFKTRSSKSKAKKSTIASGVNRIARKKSTIADQKDRFQPSVSANAGANCGIGPGGFQPGNKCQKGGGGGNGGIDGKSIPKGRIVGTRTLQKKLQEGHTVHVDDYYDTTYSKPPQEWKVVIASPKSQILTVTRSVGGGKTETKDIGIWDVFHADAGGRSYVNGNSGRYVKLANEKSGDQTTNSNGDFEMKTLSDKQRKLVVDNLINNCDCEGKPKGSGPWSEDDREALMAVKDEKLMAFDAQRVAANEMPAFIKKKVKAKNGEKDMEDEDETDEKPTGNSDGTMTMKEFMAKAPPELKAILNNAERVINRRKEELVSVITANTKNKFTPEFLMTKDEDELEAIASLAEAPVAPNTVNRFLGQAPIGNVSANDIQKFREEDQDFEVPTFNYEEHIQNHTKKFA